MMAVYVSFSFLVEIESPKPNGYWNMISALCVAALWVVQWTVLPLDFEDGIDRSRYGVSGWPLA